MKDFRELISLAKKRGERTCVVVRAEDETVLEGVKLAQDLGMIAPILIGDAKAIEALGRKVELQLTKDQVIDVKEEGAALREAVRFVKEQNGILMKGQISTAAFLKGILDKEFGLRTGRMLSHVAVLEVPGYHKLMLMSDGGMNPKLDLKTRIDIISNALELARSLGIVAPRVALVAASEVVNPDMPETADAVQIANMSKEGKFAGAIVEGPFGFDVAISKEAADHKNLRSQIAGDTDILIMPNIAAGNIWAKGLMYFARAKAAGIIMGAAKPVVMLSRADPPETKLNSIALGILNS